MCWRVVILWRRSDLVSWGIRPLLEGGFVAVMGKETTVAMISGKKFGKYPWKDVSWARVWAVRQERLI